MGRHDVPHDGTRRALPVADPGSVRRHARMLVREHRRSIVTVVGLHALAAIAALAGPRLVGLLVDRLSEGTTNAEVNRIAALLAAVVVLQTVLTWFARRASFVMGESIFASLRERFIRTVVGLPLSTVERAGTGDLVARTTNDVEAMKYVVRFGVPSMLVAAVTVVLTGAAAVLTSWSVSLALLTCVPLILLGTRWYLRHAPEGYLWERRTYADINAAVTETVDGARTVDALRLGSTRRGRVRDAVGESFRAESYTLYLRSVWFPQVDFGLLAPQALTLLWGGWLVHSGHASTGEVTTVVLYANALVDPFDELLMWIDELQVAASSLARIIGVEEVPPDRTPTGESPTDATLLAHDVRYAYRPGHDVLHGVDLDLRPGERLAVVGPSGAGKSTLGRLLAGIDGPSSGQVAVGGVPLVDLDLDTLRGEVALVTQEHHVFVGTLRDNLLLARPDADDEHLWEALDAVDARAWAESLGKRLDTQVGAGGHSLTEAQSQQLALARLVLADPHTLVLDEATSLLDPRAARHLERSLAAVVTGRTVVAVAHRLHTAHDADRVAVVEDGRISEIGSHHELIEHDGSYAALWRSWRDEPTDVQKSPR